ncbi:MAG: ferrous iron transporter B, partial [Thermoplasmata archaeon]
DDHLEDSLKNITSVLPEMPSKRTIGIKALEEDEEYLKNVLSEEDYEKVKDLTNEERRKIEDAHPGIPMKDAMLRERHAKAGAIAASVIERSKREKFANIEKLDDMLTSPRLGLIILSLVLLGMMFLIFYIGGIIEGYIVSVFDTFVMNPLDSALVGTNPLLRNVILYSMHGIEAGLGIVIPYIGLFYIFIGILEDTGYLSRAALLLDNACHKFGLHGKAIIPIVLAFGCNVPAILATRTLSSKRERIITGILATLTPCSARTIVILGLVGKFVSIWAAFSLYAFDIAIIIVVGYILGKYLPGEKTGLVMEMPILRMPDFVGSLKKAWLRMQEFVYVAFPLIILGSSGLGILSGLELLDDIQSIFEEPSMLILGLPGFAVTALIIGIIRKEMALEMLAVLGGTMVFSEILTNVQMYVFSLVCIIYVPCIATIAVLKREFGIRDSLLITTFTVLLSILIGGTVFRLLSLISIF